MNDKASRKLSVANELYESIQTFDAVPMSMDLAPEFWRPSYTKKAEPLHSSLEKGMKWMGVDGEPSDRFIKEFEKKFRRWRHDLVEIYRGLSDSDRELLDKAFNDAVSFYGIQTDRKGWKHFRCLKTYLEKTGTEKMYQKLRYWHSDVESDLFEKPTPDLLINREMVRFIYDVLTGHDNPDGGPFSVSQLVEREILESFIREGYVANVNSQRYREDHQALEEDIRLLWQWALNERDSLLLAIKDAYEHNFDVLNDWGNTVLKGVYVSLKETDDPRIKPALTYKLSTFGAKTSDCDDETIESAHVRQVGRRGTRESVETPFGWPLGNIEKRHDGLWTADYLLAKRPELAVDRNHAIGLLIENETEKVSVALNGGTPRETWARFSKRYLDSRIEVSYEFWDANHGIVVGDEISILGAGQVITLPDPTTHGIVESVNNHEVVIAVSISR